MTRFAQDDRRHALWLTIAAIGLVLAANHIGARRTATYRCAHHISGACATGRR